ncbi:lytic transglycosylase domain-containing protein [Tomitella biformata]|uniref:lytic transglycosylase domain-containing protein n=1 Tax=Tomitella biformata TaxID=630403 RepID=UPI0004B2AC8C|nr:lytic murein transglycosylase [Tomitella biformata]
MVHLMARGVQLISAVAVLSVAASALASCAMAPPPEVPTFSPPALGAALPAIDIEAPDRSADQLADWAAPLADELRISQTALEAYGFAAAVLAQSAPGCGVGWTTIAGIGSVESGHGTHNGASVGPDGNVAPPIRGIALDGRPGVALIMDTDGGRLDGDAVHDRALGPTQFIPETWERWGVDANGDGVADPDSIDDAALTTARYLCASTDTMTTAEGWSKALFTYNMSTQYALDVQHRANAYAAGLRP